MGVAKPVNWEVDRCVDGRGYITSAKSETMESSRSRSYPNSADFLSHYSNLCALHNCYPIQAIRNSVKEGVLNCQVCRLRKGDWMPLLTALKVNQVLHTVVFHRRWDEKGQSLLKGQANLSNIEHGSSVLS